jgi:hypothetical protein
MLRRVRLCHVMTGYVTMRGVMTVYLMPYRVMTVYLMTGYVMLPLTVKLRHVRHCVYCMDPGESEGELPRATSRCPNGGSYAAPSSVPRCPVRRFHRRESRPTP